jgi:hypothetical protein
MKDAAINQTHHGMRAEEDMLSYSCNSKTPIIGTPSTESVKRCRNNG